MIYTLTLNPAIDYTVGLEKFSVGQLSRTQSERLSFGGKGINVSALLNSLGVESRALGFVAGFTGDALCSALSDTGINTDFVKIENGFTRINVKIKAQVESEINARGPEISENDINTLFKRIDSVCDGDILVLSGSIPRGVPCDIYSKIMRRLENRSVRIALDCEGEALLSALKYRPFVIKPNLCELEAVIGRRLEDIEQVKDSMTALKQMGALNVITSLGERGAVLLDEQGVFHICEAPKINAVNTVGAGDSLLAAFLYGLPQGYDYALKIGVAAGSATAYLGHIADSASILQMFEKIPE